MQLPLVHLFFKARSHHGTPESHGDSTHYETLGGGFEGDMKFPDGSDPRKPHLGKGAASAGNRQWPNNVIPYDLTAITSSEDRTKVVNAMKTLMNAVGKRKNTGKPCVTFQEKSPSDKDFIKVNYDPNGCSATVGYNRGKKMELSLLKGYCFESGHIQHELMHILGFHHEQSRPDRDSYITVNYQNIKPHEEDQFTKYHWGSQILNQNIPYDYNSIMHYSATAFSNNGKPTIVPKKPGAKIGQREKLSDIDVREIRAYYSC